jgi:Skp family chaperone for outer membrane proteins
MPGLGRACAALALSLSLAAAAARAEDAAKPGAAAPVVIVVDVQAIQRDSLAGKSITSQREKYQMQFQSELDATRKQLQETEQELAKQQGATPQPIFAQKVQAFEQQAAGFQRRAQGAVRALDKSSSLASNDLSKAIIEATNDVAGELGANLVLHKHQVFLHDPRMDVTQMVLDRVNKRLPTIAFPTPVVEGEGGATASAPTASAKSKK